MHRTQDAGDEKCYADFARGGESHATERPPWERVQRGHRSQVVVEQSTSETQHAKAQTTASATASAAILSEAPKEAAGASSSVLKGMGTWVFEKDWAIAPPVVDPEPSSNTQDAGKGKVPSETHEKYKWPEMNASNTVKRASRSHGNMIPLGSETINYTSVTHGDFVPREYSVREPIKPPTTCLSDHDHEAANGSAIGNEAYLTTKDCHYHPKSKSESSNTIAAGNANTVITTYNIINGSPGLMKNEEASTKALPYEGYYHNYAYGKKTPRPAA